MSCPLKGLLNNGLFIFTPNLETFWEIRGEVGLILNEVRHNLVRSKHICLEVGEKKVEEDNYKKKMKCKEFNCKCFTFRGGHYQQKFNYHIRSKGNLESGTEIIAHHDKQWRNYFGKIGEDGWYEEITIFHLVSSNMEINYLYNVWGGWRKYDGLTWLFFFCMWGGVLQISILY